RPPPASRFFPLNDPATPETYTLSLHDALPICRARGAALKSAIQRLAVHLQGQEIVLTSRQKRRSREKEDGFRLATEAMVCNLLIDRKSTRLNSSHVKISYAVFCLKKKNNRERY